MNIENRNMYSACRELFLPNGQFKTTERSDSTISQLSLFIRHFM
ncbi:hypothetical protein D1AOALGA4SA_10306 [Olavius algarvensis Delta 1 endosymbiont]|nr:hypothetical protein D1AOALGA4SA_10306 [Olavius algarvensis Delta 1 endosymbiont]